MQFFRELGSLVEQRWRDADYSEEEFPGIAEQSLAETAPYKRVDPWDVIRWVNTTPEMPEQQDVQGLFGQPPVTVFNGHRFYIDVYYWLDGTTSLHQHAFSGAFQVLLGSSILGRYDFAEKRRINAHFLTGDITLRGVELLEVGDVRQILPGKEYIHSLFHLERPSATIIIRTRLSPEGSPQYNYHAPYIAIDPFFKSPTVIRRVQCAALLLNTKHPDADELIGDLLLRSDFQTAYSILDLVFDLQNNDRLERAFGLTTGKQRFLALVDKARSRHGDLIDLCQPVFEEMQRQQNLVQRRGQIAGNEHRFFLALLLNVPDRTQFLDLVGKRFPERHPVQTVTDWLDELASTMMIGSTEANVLGIDEVDEDYLLVFQYLLEGRSIEHVRAAFVKGFPSGYPESLGNKPEELFDTIRNSILFRSILSDRPPILSPKATNSIAGGNATGTRVKASPTLVRVEDSEPFSRRSISS